MQGDVVSNFISRVGATGLIVIFSLVFFAFLAGGIVAHRLNASNSTQVQQQGEQQDQADNAQGESKGKASPKHPKASHEND